MLTAGQTPLLRVILVVTINGIPYPLMDGLVTNNEVGAGSQPGESIMSITGEDLTKVMDLQDFSGIPYPAMPAEARVTLILSKYGMFGMIPLVIPSISIDIPNPTSRIPKHQGTDLAYVRQLASEAGYVFHIDPGPAPGTNTAYWGPEFKIGVPQPALNMDMDGKSNVESLSFNLQTADASLPVVHLQDPLTKISLILPIPKVNPLQPPLGILPMPVSKVDFLKETSKKSAMGAIGDGLAAASKTADSVKAEGTLDVVRYGRLLKARGLVGVRGAGPAFNGLYFVKSVTTTLKRGELKQKFTLTRNALVSITPKVPV